MSAPAKARPTNWRARMLVEQRRFALNRARWLKSAGLEFHYEVSIAREAHRALLRRAQ